MINTYLGTFANAQELRDELKARKIDEYRNLCKRFLETPTMELSVMLSDLAATLVNNFSLTWEEVEELEA